MIKVFLSFSHEDEALRAELDKHLGALKHEKIIATWWDHQVPVGSNWDEQILGQLEEADLILLLVSSSFLNSHYCYVEEMKRAIERHDRREAMVVPILLRPCHWKPAPFAKIQGLPKGMVPVTKVPEQERDEVWAEIAEGIHQAAIACNRLTGSGATKSESRSASHPSITIAGMRAVDEGEIDSIIRDFMKGEKVGIKWPDASDQLISLMREGMKKLEADIPGEYAKRMILHAQEAAASALRYRRRCEQHLPELMSMMSDYTRSNSRDQDRNSDFYKRCWASAIKHYLLWANFLGHREMSQLSSWGEAGLRLKKPVAWIPFSKMSDQEWLADLYPSLGQSVTRVELRRIAGEEIGGPVPCSIYVPRISIDDEGRFATDFPTLICEWVIPQVELGRYWWPRPGPKSYNGVWEGRVPQ